MLFYVVLLTMMNGLKIDGGQKDCDEDVVSRFHQAPIVFSGTIRDLIYNEQFQTQSAKVEIKRIYKGEEMIDKLNLTDTRGRFLPVKHSICTVWDLPLNCNTIYRIFDTWLFFGKASDGVLKLTSSPHRVSVHVIAVIEATTLGEIRTLVMMYTLLKELKTTKILELF